MFILEWTCKYIPWNSSQNVNFAHFCNAESRFFECILRHATFNIELDNQTESSDNWASCYLIASWSNTICRAGFKEGKRKLWRGIVDIPVDFDSTCSFDSKSSHIDSERPDSQSQAFRQRISTSPAHLQPRKRIGYCFELKSVATWPLLESFHSQDVLVCSTCLFKDDMAFRDWEVDGDPCSSEQGCEDWCMQWYVAVRIFLRESVIDALLLLACDDKNLNLDMSPGTASDFFSTFSQTPTRTHFCSSWLVLDLTST